MMWVSKRILDLKKPLKKDIYSYIIVMFLGMACASLFFGGESTVFWAVNLCGWVVFFAKYVVVIPRKMGIMAVLYILMSMLPLLFNAEYVSISVKGIGTSVGILIVPLYLCFFVNLQNEKTHIKEILNILDLISIIGTILFCLSILLGWRDYIAVLNGTKGAYDAKISGILTNKNMYGALLSLSTCSDFFAIKINETYLGQRKRFRWIVLGAKIIGVVFSFSRAALLQLGIAALCFVWIGRKRNKKEWFLLIAALIFIIAAYLKNDSFRQIILEQILRVETGDAGRSVGSKLALDKVTDDIWSVLFGVGYFGIEKLEIDIDNSYYNVFFSGGICKCIFYGYWAFYSIRAISVLKRRSALLSNMCLSMAISYFAYAKFESVPLFELGILTFIFMFFMYIVPMAYEQCDKNN